MPVSQVFGVDVGRRELAIARHDPPVGKSIPNTEAAIARWLRGLQEPAMIGMESTGAYHQLIASLALAAGHQVYVLDPRRLKAYRNALGVRAKTDRGDAELIAHYLARQGPSLHPFVPMAPALEALTRLMRRRSRVVVCRQRLAATLRDCPECGPELRRIQLEIRQLLAQIDTHCEEIIAADPARRARRERLRTIPGIGPLTSSALLTLLERIPYENSDALVAATGLDPRPNDSGDHRGRRKLTKRGPSELRRLLYNAAMAAARESKPFQDAYRRYRARGLNSTTALIAVARKLVRIAFALDRSGVSFDPSKLAAGLRI
jgi:transposase